MFCESGLENCLEFKTNEMSIVNSSKEPSQNCMSHHENGNLTLHTH